MRSAVRFEEFRHSTDGDVFAKCHGFAGFLGELKRHGIYQSQYRVTLESALDHRIVVRDPCSGHPRPMVCFDSNSYLGLHLHPRVVAAVRRALDRAGYGTPSAQLLGGTSRWLRGLEDAVSAFHGREATIVFPSGYAANVGALTALLDADDLVARDRFSHASIHDGCRWSGARYGRAYAHLDTEDLDRALEEGRGAAGRLVVSDGVFSMHGRLAPLPRLREVATRHRARLMIDEAHALGVIGPTGRGLEEHFGLPGAVDVLMGTFSKAPGALGGYVTGSAELVEYLRFFARSSMFTAALPASLCAGLTEALRVMDEEPEHRARLWANARRFWDGLRSASLPVSPLESPIVPIVVGTEERLWAISRGLFDAGIKCGTVCYPAVPRGESLLRFTVNARHTADELDRTVESVERVARRHGLEEGRAAVARLA